MNVGAKKNSGKNISRHLADLAGPEVEQLVSPSSIFIQPLGAIEQHGPHLPLSVDYVIAKKTAEAVVAARGEELDLWLLPTLSVTKSNEHSWSAGTLWLSATTMLAVLDEIAECIKKTGAKKLVFLNAHGGNSSLLNVACRDIRLKHDLMTFLAHPFVPIDQGGQGGNKDDDETNMDVHGGHSETSIMLHLKPELVKMDLAKANIPKEMAENEFVRFGGQVSFGWASNDFGKDGLIGDPTGATAEAGKKFLESVVKSLGDQLKEIAGFNFGS